MMSNTGFLYSDKTEVVLRTKHFMVNGYNDYIAGRFLLNNGFPNQGIVLASSAIEKYLKSLLVAMEVDFRWFHLDKLGQAKKYFKGTIHESLIESFDPVFIEILGKAYAWRYYHDLSVPDSFGVFVNQFIGELDLTVARFESTLRISKASDSNPVWQSPYKRALASKDSSLFHNNYVLNGLDKFTFMTSKSQAFGLYFDPATYLSVEVRLKEELHIPYYGMLYRINIEMSKPS